MLFGPIMIAAGPGMLTPPNRRANDGAGSRLDRWRDTLALGRFPRPGPMALPRGRELPRGHRPPVCRRAAAAASLVSSSLAVRVAAGAVRSIGGTPENAVLAPSKHVFNRTFDIGVVAVEETAHSTMSLIV